MVPKIRPMEMPPSRAQVAGSGSRRLSPASAQLSYFGRKRLDSPRGDEPAIPKGSRVRWSRHSAGCRRSSPCGRKAGGGATLCTSSVLIWPQTSYGQRGKDWEQTPLERPIGHASDQSAPPSRSGDRLRVQPPVRRPTGGDPELGEAPTSIERHLLHRAGNPGAGLGPLLYGYCEGGPYFSWSATLATPALAQASSCSCVDPELPTPPIASLPIMIGTPPPKARMSATSRCAAYLGSSVRF
jgi:hypothetical protein